MSELHPTPFDRSSADPAFVSFDPSADEDIAIGQFESSEPVGLQVSELSPIDAVALDHRSTGEPAITPHSGITDIIMSHFHPISIRYEQLIDHSIISTAIRISDGVATDMKQFSSAIGEMGKQHHRQQSDDNSYQQEEKVPLQQTYSL